MAENTLMQGPELTLASIPTAQAIVRTSDSAVIAGLDLPGACSLRRRGTEVAVWLAPTEWLMYRTDDTTPADLVSDLESRIGDGPAYVFDTSGQRTPLLLIGSRAETVLAHGCSLDLSARVFGDNAAAQTQLAQAGILIHRTNNAVSPDSAGFVLFVRSSYAHYLITWLRDAATEYLTAATH